MYDVWRVNFRVDTAKRGPCDPVFSSKPLLNGNVGDADPFSDAFGKCMTLSEAPVMAQSPECIDVCSSNSSTSRLLSLQSSISRSPFTPRTEASASSCREDYELTGGQRQLQPFSPSSTCWSGGEDSSYSMKTVASGVSTPFFEVKAEPAHMGQHPTINSARGASLAVINSPLEVIPGEDNLSNGTGYAASANAQRKRKNKSKSNSRSKAPFSDTRRAPIKSREEHLVANKVAAAKCRQQRKVHEENMKDMANILMASMESSKTMVKALQAEITMLKQQVWNCPNCTIRYHYSFETRSMELPSDTRYDQAP